MLLRSYFNLVKLDLSTQVNYSLFLFHRLAIHQLLANSILKCDIELRRTLYKEIWLAGGTTYLNGFGERLFNEIKKITPSEIRKKIHKSPERNISCWIGGSILSSLGTFKR